MNRVDELRHLRFGPTPDERPGGAGVARFDLECDGNAAQVVGRCREVLEVVVGQDPDEWPTLSEWRSLLPGWFVAACAPEETTAERDLWMAEYEAMSGEQKREYAAIATWRLSAWLFWFQPAERFWFWWDASIAGPDACSITVEVTDVMFPEGSLWWLVRAAGATNMSDWY